MIFFIHGIYFKSIRISSLILLIYSQKNRLSSEKLLKEKIIYFSWSKKFVIGHTQVLDERWRWKVARGGRWQESFGLKAKKAGKGAESWRASETWPAIGIRSQLWALVWFEMRLLAEPSQTNPPYGEQSLLRGLYGDRDCVCVPTLKMLQKCLLSRWKNRDRIVIESVTSQRGTASNGSGHWCSLSSWLMTLTPLMLALTLFEIYHQLEKKEFYLLNECFYFTYLSSWIQFRQNYLFGGKSDSGYLLSQLWPPRPFPFPQHAGAMDMRHYAIPTRASASAPPRASRGMNVSCKYHTSGTPGTIHTSPGSVKGLWNCLNPKSHPLRWALFPWALRNPQVDWFEIFPFLLQIGLI